MIDLVYDDAAVPDIRAAFPHVKVTDARDFIHEDRVQIELPDEDERAYIKHAIRTGYYEVSLSIQFMMRAGGAEADKLRGILAEMEREKSDTLPCEAGMGSEE